MACLADINVSQGSVATYARRGGIFNIHLTTNLPRNLPVNFLIVQILQNCGHESVAHFLAHPVYTLPDRNHHLANTHTRMSRCK